MAGRTPEATGRRVQRRARHPLHGVHGHPHVAPDDPCEPWLWRRNDDVPPRGARPRRARRRDQRLPDASGQGIARAHTSRDRCCLRGHQSPQLLQVHDPCGDSVESECDGAAQWAYRPSWATVKVGVHLASRRQGIRRGRVARSGPRRYRRRRRIPSSCRTQG